MGRTRIKGLELAGVRMAIEVPSHFSWVGAGAGLGRFECSARDAQIHVGVRIATPRLPTGETLFYETAGRRFEIGKDAGDWEMAVYDAHGRCERSAFFDSSLSQGEVTLSPEAAAQGRLPLDHPLDELLLLHRVVEQGCLVLRGSVVVREGEGMVFLSENGAQEMTHGLAGNSQHLVIRPSRQVDGIKQPARVHATPWGAGPPTASLASAPLSKIYVVRSGGTRPVESLGTSESVGEILQHAFAPLYDPEAADRLFNVVRDVSRQTPVVRMSRPELKHTVPLVWERSEATFGFSLPTH